MKQKTAEREDSGDSDCLELQGWRREVVCRERERAFRALC